MNIKLKKVYTVSKKGKPEQPRFFLQHIVCEAAGFKHKEEVYIKVKEDIQEILYKITRLRTMRMFILVMWRDGKVN